MPGEREYQLPTDPAQLAAFNERNAQLRNFMGVDPESSRGGRSGQDENGRYYWIPEGSDTPQYFDAGDVAQDPSKIGKAGGYIGDYDGMYYMARPNNPWTLQDNGPGKPIGQLAMRVDEKDTGMFGGLAPYLGMAASAFGLPSMLGNMLSGGAAAGSMASILGNAAGSGIMSGVTSSLGGGKFGKGFLGGAVGSAVPAVVGGALQGSGLPDWATKALASGAGGAARGAISGRGAGIGAINSVLGSLGGSAGRELTNIVDPKSPLAAALIGQLPGLFRSMAPSPSAPQRRSAPRPNLSSNNQQAIMAEARRRGLL